MRQVLMTPDGSDEVFREKLMGLIEELAGIDRAVQALCDAHGWWKLSPRATLGGR
jgi:hypothetical protein